MSHLKNGQFYREYFLEQCAKAHLQILKEEEPDQKAGRT